MDTPTITQYYRESDPARRLALLNMSIEAGEEPELNQIRRELWDIRYQDPSELGGDTRADGLIALWMLMEFNKDSGKRFMESAADVRRSLKQLNKMKFQEICAKGKDYEELLYRECCHMVKTYMELSESDKAYNSTLFGILKMSSERAKDKLKADIYDTAVVLPQTLKMEEELGIVTRAAREMYETAFFQRGKPEQTDNMPGKKA